VSGPKGKYYIRAESSRVDNRTLVLKQGDSFGVFDRHGDIHPIRAGEEGIYHRGVRYLSHLDLRLGNDRPLLLNSGVRRDSAVLGADMTNPDGELGGLQLLRGDVHLFRTKFLWDGACYDRVRITGYHKTPMRVPLTVKYSSDFADVYEVRGLPRRQRGQRLDPSVDPSGVNLAYQGRDDVLRAAHISWSPAPVEVNEGEARFELTLPARGTATLVMITSMLHNPTAPASDGTPHVSRWGQARQRLETEARGAWEGSCGIRTSNDQFNDWMNQGTSDLRMLLTRTKHGWYPYAGVPWFSTVFGRDGLITAFQTLWFQPSIARGVLSYLAAHQGTVTDIEHDSDPGKILHETRQGEMPALGEVPFGMYFGSVDSTPLFIMLSAAYLERTGDLPFVERLWPHVERALAWMDGPGDPDQDGFLEYERRNPEGLLNQGWKDSDIAVFHSDGTLARGAIALCEVQGYAFAAYRAAAKIARAMGREDQAKDLESSAVKVQERFESTFWSPRLGTYALALDGENAACEVQSSNPGHLLWTGIAPQERASKVASKLLDRGMYSGWGIRTVSDTESLYNPMTYHNGSVWPHDNAIIALGLSDYGFKVEALQVLTGLFDAGMYLDYHRMPELFCGFPRRPFEGPTLFPLACSPQAWAAGTPLMLLQAALGLKMMSFPHNRLVLDRPRLPPMLDRVTLRGLTFGPGAGKPSNAAATVDLAFERAGDDVAVHVPRRKGDVEINILK
jgi:glycogen debranching enzyme